MKAVLRKARISPKKANLIAGMVRGKQVTEALNMLEVMPKKGAELLYKVLLSAVSNAKNNFKQMEAELYINKILVTKGFTLKRSNPVSRGRAHPILKRTAHITVEVGLPLLKKDTKKGEVVSKASKTKASKSTEVAEASPKKTEEKMKKPAKKTPKKS